MSAARARVTLTASLARVTLTGGAVLIAGPAAAPAAPNSLGYDRILVMPGARGADGRDGAGVVQLSAVCGEAVAAGQPLYLNQVDGKAWLARADTPAKAAVTGLARTAAATGFAVEIATGGINLADWTAVTGAAALNVGSRYYLGLTPGTLTTAAPASQGQSVTETGLAVSPTLLVIRPLNTVLL